MKCMFCSFTTRDLLLLGGHLKDAHVGMVHAPVLGKAVEHMANVPRQCTELQVIECDIDAIYRTRPDLVRARA